MMICRIINANSASIQAAQPHVAIGTNRKGI